MHDLITPLSELDTDKLRARGLCAQPFPEFPSGDEIKTICHVLNAENAEAWTFEHGHIPEHLAPLTVEDVAKLVFEKSYLNILVHITDIDLHIWIPEGGEFFVIVGAQDAIKTIIDEEIFEYTFDEYRQEPSFSTTLQVALTKIQDRYQFG